MRSLLAKIQQLGPGRWLGVLAGRAEAYVQGACAQNKHLMYDLFKDRRSDPCASCNLELQTGHNHIKSSTLSHNEVSQTS